MLGIILGIFTLAEVILTFSPFAQKRTNEIVAVSFLLIVFKYCEIMRITYVHVIHVLYCTHSDKEFREC